METVRYIERATGEEKEETVLGEEWLRRLYERPIGKALLPLVGGRLFSRLYGWWQSRPGSKERIAAFVETLGIDPRESERPPSSYDTLADFFVRKLKAGARPLDADPGALLSPADCRLVLYPRIDGSQVLPVKGRRYSIGDLLDDAELARTLAGGDVVCCRLCPADYHRYHFPASGRAGEPRDLNGRLLSVSPIAVAAGHPVFTENHRVVVPLATERFGDIAIVLVGATCVGRIVMTHGPGASVQRGQEMGYFGLGGSSMLLVLPPDRVQWDEDLLDHSTRGFETLVHMGERLGLAI